MYKREIYNLVQFPEIRTAEDWYLKKKLNRNYHSYIEEYKTTNIAYHYNYPNEDGLYITKKNSKGADALKYLEDQSIVNTYNEPIDIVVTYLDSSVKEWQEQYSYWRSTEIAKGLQRADNIQAFGPERFRNWDDAFKYWFRGIEKNMPWLRYIHLVVMDEKHIPDWLNTKHPKLKIHYHSEIIPKEYLPTFNAIQITNYVSNIENLSDNFLFSDDDWYAINKINKEQFYNDGNYLVNNSKPKKSRYQLNDIWNYTLNNCLDWYDKLFGKDQTYYSNPHLFHLVNKDIAKQILKETEETYNSRFRSDKNILVNWLAYIRAINVGKFKPVDDFYKNAKFSNISEKTKFNDFKQYSIVCFNDSEHMKDFTITKNNLLTFFREVFPEKSDFEKGDLNVT